MGQRMKLELSQRRVCVIANGASGRKDASDSEAVLRERLGPVVRQFEIRRLWPGRDVTGLAKAAVEDGFDLILALGGDGTQAGVAAALAGSDAVMGALPGGTFNYFVREHGIGETLNEAIDTLLNGRIARISVGEINGRVFLNNASFGAYPEILETREGIYKRWGRSRVAAYFSVIVALANLRRPMHLRAEVQGETRSYRTPLAFIARSAFQLKTFGLEGAEAVAHDQFALFVAHAQTPMALIGAALRLAFGQTARDSDFDLIEAASIEIETRPPSRLVARDGEKERMSGPFHLRVLPAALQLVLPAEDPETKDK